MRTFDVLFLCETNAAVSLMAEALVNHRADPRIRAFSAGRSPAPRMLEEARAALAAAAVPVDGLEPKAWTIFSLPGARRPDVVVDLATVTWTAPGVSAFADVPVLRWPLRDPALASDRRERRGLAEVVRDALSGRIADELVTRLFTPDRDRRTPGLALAGP